MWVGCGGLPGPKVNTPASSACPAWGCTRCVPSGGACGVLQFGGLKIWGIFRQWISFLVGFLRINVPHSWNKTPQGCPPAPRGATEVSSGSRATLCVPGQVFPTHGRTGFALDSQPNQLGLDDPEGLFPLNDSVPRASAECVSRGHLFCSPEPGALGGH